jgi:phosphatidylinositol alpha-mannosyltransferase
VRLALTNPYCWPHVRRGSESVMHSLAAWLGDEGVDATIVAGHQEASRYEIDGVRYTTVRARDHSDLHRELTPMVTLIPALARELRRMRPDLVHAFSYHDATAAQLARLPFVISYAGIIAMRSWDGLRLQRRLFERASARADAVFCPSAATARSFRCDYGLRPEVIPYGLDTASYALDRPTVPGRIFCAATPNDRRKRPELLVDAFAQVARRDPEAHLRFGAAASDAKQAALRERLDADLQDRLEFLGEIDQEQLRVEYATAAVSCLTSTNEAYGMVVLESFAAGTPVVGTRSGALPELINDDGGGTFDLDDVEGCAAEIERQLRRSPAEATAQCRAHASRFDWDAVGPQVTDLYARVAA